MADRANIESSLRSSVAKLQLTEQQLADLVLPQSIYDQAELFVVKASFEERYSEPRVFTFMLSSSVGLSLTEAQSEIKSWKVGLQALLRYPINLLLAPNRPELKRVKVSTSYYIYHVQRKLKEAESFLNLMGYERIPRSTDLVLQGFSLDRMYSLVSDIVILHEDLEVVSFLISRVKQMSRTLDGDHIEFKHIMLARRFGPADKMSCLDFIMDGEAARYVGRPPLPMSNNRSSETTTNRYQYNEYTGDYQSRYDQTGSYRYQDQTGPNRYQDQTGSNRYQDQTGSNRYQDQTGSNRYQDQTGSNRYQDQTGSNRYQDPYDPRYHQSGYGSQQVYRTDRNQYYGTYHDNGYGAGYSPQYRYSDRADSYDQQYYQTTMTRDRYENGYPYNDQQPSPSNQYYPDYSKTGSNQYYQTTSTPHRSFSASSSSSTPGLSDSIRSDVSLADMPRPIMDRAQLANLMKGRGQPPPRVSSAPRGLSMSSNDSFDQEAVPTSAQLLRRHSSTPSETSFTQSTYRPFGNPISPDPPEFTIGDIQEEEEEVSRASSKKLQKGRSVDSSIDEEYLPPSRRRGQKRDSPPARYNPRGFNEYDDQRVSLSYSGRRSSADDILSPNESLVNLRPHPLETPRTYGGSKSESEKIRQGIREGPPSLPQNKPTTVDSKVFGSVAYGSRAMESRTVQDDCSQDMPGTAEECNLVYSDNSSSLPRQIPSPSLIVDVTQDQQHQQWQCLQCNEWNKKDKDHPACRHCGEIATWVEKPERASNGGGERIETDKFLNGGVSEATDQQQQWQCLQCNEWNKKDKDHPACRCCGEIATWVEKPERASHGGGVKASGERIETDKFLSGGVSEATPSTVGGWLCEYCLNINTDESRLRCEACDELRN